MTAPIAAFRPKLDLPGRPADEPGATVESDREGFPVRFVDTVDGAGVGAPDMGWPQRGVA